MIEHKCDVCETLIKRGEEQVGDYWGFGVEWSFDSMDEKDAHDGLESFIVCQGCYIHAKETSYTELLGTQAMPHLMIAIKALIEHGVLVCTKDNKAYASWCRRRSQQAEEGEEEE
jgi:hypothetical protein